MELENLKFPIGRYAHPEVFTDEMLADSISVIAGFPTLLTLEVEAMSDEKLDTPYRPGGWSVRQVIHHLADSHINSFTRFKLALTEETPVIKPYEEALWAELPDGMAEIGPSLRILDGLHRRWSILLNSISEEQLARCFLHPEQQRKITIAEATGSYAWHCRHHLTHITGLKQRMGWK